MAQSYVSDTMNPAGRLPPTLTPTGHFSGKPTLPISRSVTLIGARKQARLQLISSTVSQNHALIINADSGPYIRDLASREHTLVNGIEVKEGALNDGDDIQLGRFTFRFNASPQTQPVGAIRNIRPAPMARLEVDGEPAGLPFESKSILIGRREGCEIVLPQDSVSTTHAIVFEMDGKRFVRDLASRTGTFVNGALVHQVELSPGDEITIGGTSLRYAAEAGEVEEAFAPPMHAADLGVHAEDLGTLEPAEAEAPPAEADEEAPIPIEGLELEPAAEEEPIELFKPPAPVAEAAAEAPPAPPATEALELEEQAPAEREDAALSPADLDASKDVADLDLPPRRADEAAASRGDLTAEHLDLDQETAEVSVDDLLDLAPAEAVDEAPVEPEPSESQDIARFQGQGPAASLHTAPPLGVDLGADELGGGLGLHEPVDLVEDQEDAPAEAIDEALGLAAEAPSAEPVPPPTSPSLAPGASQLDLPPLEQVEVSAEAEPVEEEPVDELEIAEVEAAEELQAPFEPVSLDQQALEAEVEGPDVAPDESFDTLEARKAQPLDFAGEDVIAAPETFAEAPTAPQAETEREAETDAVEFEEPLVTPEADLADTIVGEQTPVFELEEPPAPAAPEEEAPTADAMTDAFGEPPIALEPMEPPSGEGAGLEILSSTEPAMPLEIEAEALETAPAQAADEVEVLEHTEATPESALPLAQEPAAAPEAPAEVEEVELTDTGFGRAVEELSAESKPIVEELVEPSAAVEAEPIVEEIAEPSAAVEAEPVDEEIAPLAELEEEPIVEEVVEPSAAAAETVVDATVEPPERFSAPGEPPRAIDDELALDLLTSEPVASGEADELMVEVEQPPAERAADAPEPLIADENLAPQAEEKLFDRDAVERAAQVAEQPPADLDTAVADALAIEEPGVGAGESRDTLGEWGLELEPEEEAVAAADVPPVTTEPVEPTAPPPPSRLAPGASRLDLEPILDTGDESAALGEPLEVREDELDLEPIAEAPPPAGEAPAAPTEPSGPRPAPPAAGGPHWAGVAPFNWGANQEHFLGGMPLKLGGASAQSTPATPLPRPPLAAPAATRQPLTDDSISMSGPAIADRPRTARPQPMPAQRPGPRRGQASPFAGGEARGPQVTTGFDGLAMPPVRETDVFAPMPGSLTAGFAPGLMDDVFGGNARRTIPTPQPQVGGGGAGGTISPAAPASDAARRPQPRRATNAQPPGEAWSAERSAPNAPEAELAMAPTAPPAGANRPPALAASAQPPAPPRKKRRWFGFRLLLLFLALPCAVGAAAGAYYLMPNKSSVRGELKFVNFDRLPQKERVELAQQQKKLIADERLRSAARNKLSSLNSQLTPGFLGGGLGLARVQSSANMDMESGTLTLPLDGASGRADQTRMFALLQAMYDANTERAQAANQLSATLETLTRERAQRTRGLEELKQRIDQLAAVAQSAPDAAERKRLETEAETLRKSWDDAIVALKDLSAQVKELEAHPAPATTAATVASTASAEEVKPVASLADSDSELARLQQALKQVDQRITAVQEGGASAGLAVVTRLFDDALGAFDRQLVQAVSAAKENTPFQAYLDNAKQLSDQASERAAAFFKRQEAQYAKLAEAQANLNEKQLARRAELFKRDPEMVKLLDQKDLKTRQYNTALAQNLSKEAAEIKTELNFLDSMITARQTQVADDGFFADAIDQLQRIVEGTQKQLGDDRARTAKEMEELAAALARSRPEELSPRQKDLVQQLERSFGEMVAAREQYADAAEAANKEADEQLKTLRASADELLGKIQARKATLAEAEQKLAQAKANQPATDQAEDRGKLLAQKKTELAAAQQRHDDAKAAYLAANDKLAKLGEQVGRATAAGEERDRLLIQRDTDQRDLDQKILQYEQKKKLAELQAYPAIPSESDVKSEEAPDKRPIYSLAAFGGVAALFALGIMLSGGGRDASPTRTGEYAIEYETDEHQPDSVTNESAHEKAIEV